MLSARAIVGLTLILAAVIGGAYASYVNIRNARGPRERRFVMRACAVGWLMVFSMLALIYWLPAPARYFVAAAYFIAAPLLIYRWALTHQMIRLLEQRDRETAS